MLFVAGVVVSGVGTIHSAGSVTAIVQAAAVTGSVLPFALTGAIAGAGIYAYGWWSRS